MDRFSRKVSLLSGLSLLGMTILAPWAYMGIFQEIFALEGDYWREGLESQAWDGFVQGMWFFGWVVVWDLLVSWGLWKLLKGTHPVLSLWSGLIRGIYTLMLIVILRDLWVQVSQHAEQFHAQKDFHLAFVNFENLWVYSLGFFGVHLVLLGLCFTSLGTMKRLLGPLLIIAGLGYLTDAMVRYLDVYYEFQLTSMTFSEFTFMGELLLMIWLLYQAFSKKVNHNIF